MTQTLLAVVIASCAAAGLGLSGGHATWLTVGLFALAAVTALQVGYLAGTLASHIH